MKFDEETLIEIENYIQVLDEQVGLKPETVRDIEKAINKQKCKLKNCSIPPDIKSLSDLDGKTIPVRFTVTKRHPNIHIDDI